MASVGLLLGGAARGRAEFALVEKGEARAALVLAERPTRSAELAARELQAHLREQTGVDLPILHEAEPLPPSLRPFYLGNTRAAREAGLAPGSQQALLEVSPARAVLFGEDSEEFGGVDYEGLGAWPGYTIESPVTALGTLHGVYEILQRQGGIRWYLPGEVGTHIPPRASFHLPEGRHTFENWTKWRVIGSGQWGKPGDPGKADLVGVVRVTELAPLRDRVLFALRSRRGGEAFAVNHSMRHYFERFGKTHPQWWVDDRPAPEKQLKYGLAEVSDQVIRDARAWLDRPLAERDASVPGIVWARGVYWGVMPNDNRDFGTECRPPLQPERTEIGRYGAGVASNYIFDWVNRVARGIAQTHPEAWVSTSAYAGMYEPPEFPLEPNVAVAVAMADGWDAKSLENLRRWAKQAQRLFTWEYHYAWGRMYPLRPRAIAEYAKVLREVGLRGMFVEMGDHNAALYHLDAYLMTQALLNRDFDVEQELRDYYANFYGPAAAPMRTFWEALFEASARSQAGGGPVESWVLADEGGLGKRLGHLLEEARALAQGHPRVRERIALMQTGVLEPYLREVAHAQAVSARPQPVLHAGGSEEEVQIDGRLDDAAWAGAEESGAFVTLHDRPAEVRTTVRVVREEAALVFGFHCEEPRMDELVMHHSTPSAGICTDDSVELCLQFAPVRPAPAEGEAMRMRPPGGREEYLQIMANTAGITWHWWRQRYHPGEPADLGIRCAVARVEGAWQAEIRVPLALVDEAGELPAVVHANFLRNRPRGKDPRVEAGGHAVWSPTFIQNFHHPDRFGKLILTPHSKP